MSYFDGLSPKWHLAYHEDVVENKGLHEIYSFLNPCLILMNSVQNDIYIVAYNSSYSCIVWYRVLVYLKSKLQALIQKELHSKGRVTLQR